MLLFLSSSQNDKYKSDIGSDAPRAINIRSNNSSPMAKTKTIRSWNNPSVPKVTVYLSEAITFLYSDEALLYRQESTLAIFVFPRHKNNDI
jgi:hypothetical protein